MTLLGIALLVGCPDLDLRAPRKRALWRRRGAGLRRRGVVVGHRDDPGRRGAAGATINAGARARRHLDGRFGRRHLRCSSPESPSALTTQRLQGVVRSVNDLRSVRVGAVARVVDGRLPDRAADRVPRLSTAAEGLRAAQSGQIDAFIYDRPLLAWMLQQDFPRLELTPITLDQPELCVRPAAQQRAPRGAGRRDARRV